MLLNGISYFLFVLLYLGKSSLTIQFVENQFVDSYDPTIENSRHAHLCFRDCIVTYHLCIYAAFTKTWKVRGQEFELKLIDTAGQDEYAIFPAQHSMDIAGYVLVYSVRTICSFNLISLNTVCNLLFFVFRLHQFTVLSFCKSSLKKLWT